MSLTPEFIAPVIDIGSRRIAALTEKPSEVLPDPGELLGHVVPDCETTGLYVDDGDRVCAIGLAYRLKSDPDSIWYHSFPFDQGRAEDKGFSVQYYPETPQWVKKDLAGKPKGDPDNEWDWDTDYNLERNEWTVLMRWLEEAGQAVGLSNQNLRFDLHMIRAGTRHWGGVELEKYAKYDTMLATAELWPQAGTTSLKPTAERLWGAAEVAEAAVVRDCLQEVKKRYGLLTEHGPRYDLMPWEVNGPYAAADSVLTLRLEELQTGMLEDGLGDWGKVLEAIDLMRVLYRIERRGLGPLDMGTARKWADFLSARVETVAAQLPFTPVTTPRAAKYFFDELGLQPWNLGGGEEAREVVTDSTTGKTKVVKQGTLNLSVARRLGASGVPGGAEFAEYNRLLTANRMHYQGYVDLANPDDHRLRTTFRQAYVKSGRMSVERFQAQALPKHLGLVVEGIELPEPRRLFLTPEGKTRVNLDLAQAELRIAAMFCQCTVMLDALETGADFHGQTTRAVFGLTPEHPEWSLYRDIGKRLTFASIFMVGGKTFRETLWKEAELDWPLSQCNQAVYAWRRAYPQFEGAYNECMDSFAHRGFVELIDGSRSYMGPRDWPRTGWNRVVQGSLAVFVSKWLIAIEKYTAKWDALCLTVHDSVVLDLPTEVVDEAVAHIKEMTERMWREMFGIAGGCDYGSWYK